MEQYEQVTLPLTRFRSLGDFLRWHRLRLGLTQEALGEAIGVSPRSIRRWEQDLALPQGVSRERLCTLFGIDFHQLLAPSPIVGPWALTNERVPDSHSPLPQRHSVSPLSMVEPQAARNADQHILFSASTQQRLLLLKSKLRPPCLPSALVRREHLLKRLDAAREHRLTLLCASAGWGKTTVLSTWAARFPKRMAWLSLDDLDNDPIRFWVLVIEALRACLPTVGETALAYLQSSQPPALTTVLTALVHEIEAAALVSEIFLVLDDYQVIEDQSIHETLTFLLEHLPAPLHLVLSSRVEPPLPLSRWRVQGLVLELQDADLRFTLQEAGNFLQETMGCSLAQAEVQTLQERTEGWIVGLQLAALAMQALQDTSSFVKEFGGSHRLLLDYVQQEILQHQPLPIQHFLLQTAVLTQMNASLCQAVTTELASQQMLETLERSHLFVTALDEERNWYRFHCLFREALLACLRASQPEQIPLLHQRAARWHESQGDIHEALAHALAAADYDFATSLLERAAPQLWLNGGVKTVHNWIRQLPDAVLRVHARLALTAALHLLQQTQYTPSAQRAEVLAQVEQTIARLERNLKSQEGAVMQSGTEVALLESEKRLLHQRIRLLQGMSAMREAYRQGNEAQVPLIAQRLQDEALEDDVTWKMIPTFALIVSFAFRGDVTAVLPTLLEVKQRARQAQDPFAIIRTMEWITVAYLASGRLRRAYEECLQASELLKQMGEQTPTNGYLYFELAELHWMWNRLAEAHTYLRSLIHYARTWQNMDLLLWAYCKVVHVLLALDESAEAEQMLEEAERLAQYSGFALHRPRVMAARVQFWLEQENLTAAGAWAANYRLMPDTLEYIHEPEYQMLVRVYLVQQKYTEALQAVELLLRRAQDDGRGRDVVSLLALQVVALYGLGELIQARQVAARLLQLSEPEGYLRVYLDAGEPMQRVLATFLNATHGQVYTSPPTPTVSVPYVAQLVAAFEQEASRTSQGQSLYSGPVLPVPRNTAHATPPSFESLTPREQDVLRLLSAGASNQEIARQLVISLSTVKKHVSNLLGKLGADNRTQALALAHVRSLLE